ncbi:MAG: 30S ribosomal protein S24e [Candidatus Thermoplasmatota archaeon]|nr:30S ribosomal protein S24e [Candidatus Thermoplasmatota archaeon]
MDVEILNKKENALLKRVEVEFEVKHPKGPTPKRNEIRDAIASELGAKKESVVVDELNSTFGKPVTCGYAKVYKSVEDARNVELEHIQKRNNIFQEKKKPGEAKEEGK